MITLPSNSHQNVLYLPANIRDMGFIPGLGRSTGGGKWQPTPIFLPENFLGQRSLTGYSPWGHKESDMTERLHFHFSLSCIAGRNGNPLQYSCLKNPRGRGAWWAAVYGVEQSRTRLKRLNSSSSSSHCNERQVTV